MGKDLNGEGIPFSFFMEKFFACFSPVNRYYLAQ